MTKNFLEKIMFHYLKRHRQYAMYCFYYKSSSDLIIYRYKKDELNVVGKLYFDIILQIRYHDDV